MKINTFLTYLILILFFSCSKSNTRYNVEVVGHAAGGLDLDRAPFPGNTIPSILYAKDLGIKHVELDIQLNAENRWVLFHADYLEEKTNASGCINQKTTQEIRNIRYIGHPNIEIPFLIDLDLSDFQTVFLDLRDYQPCNNFQYHQAEDMLTELLIFKALHSQLHIVIVAKRPQFLNYFRQNGFDVCFEANTFEDLLLKNANFDYNYYIIRNQKVTSDNVAQIRALNKQILLFDVKSRAGNIDAMEKNPNFVVTDAIASALLLKE